MNWTGVHVTCWCSEFPEVVWCLSLWGLLSQITTVGLHINNRNLFLTGLAAGNLRSGTSVVGFWWEFSSWSIGGVFSLHSHMVEAVRGLSEFSYKGTNPIHEGRTHVLTDNQRLHLLIPLPSELGSQHMSFGRKQTFRQ